MPVHLEQALTQEGLLETTISDALEFIFNEMAGSLEEKLLEPRLPIVPCKVPHCTLLNEE